MKHINDDRFFPGDSTLETERLKEPGKNNVQFLQAGCPRLYTHFNCLSILSVEALHSKFFGEELLVHYGNEYEYYCWSRTQNNLTIL